MNLNAYQKRVNAMRLNRQTPAIKQLAEAILKEINALRSALYWALDPEDKAMDWTASLIDHAHALVDLGHEYKAALVLNPPQQPPDYDPGEENDWESVDKDAS